MGQHVAGAGLLSSGLARMPRVPAHHARRTRCRQRERSACAPPAPRPEPVRYSRNAGLAAEHAAGWSRCRGRRHVRCLPLRCPGCGAAALARDSAAGGLLAPLTRLTPLAPAGGPARPSCPGSTAAAGDAHGAQSRRRGGRRPGQGAGRPARPPRTASSPGSPRRATWAARPTRPSRSSPAATRSRYSAGPRPLNTSPSSTTPGNSSCVGSRWPRERAQQAAHGQAGRAAPDGATLAGQQQRIKRLLTEFQPQSPTIGDTITPRMREVRDEVDRRFGPFSAIGCYRPGSDGAHPLGRACDFMLSTGGVMPAAASIQKGYDIAAWAQANASRLGIMYIIYRQRIWDVRMASSAGSRWRTAAASPRTITTTCTSRCSRHQTAVLRSMGHC